MRRFANAATQASLHEPIIYDRQARQERDRSTTQSNLNSPTFPIETKRFQAPEA
jgi:hypothetical protein